MFNETLFDNLGGQDRDWSRRLGGASIALLFRVAAAALLEQINEWRSKASLCCLGYVGTA